MNKLAPLKESKSWLLLSEAEKNCIERLNEKYPLSQQENRILIEISRDLQMWDEKPLSARVFDTNENHTLKQQKSALIEQLKREWDQLKTEATDYEEFTPHSDHVAPKPGISDNPERTILGTCPVASEKTRCCNLKTLDAVINCGFDCSYCSIQSFYSDGNVLFEKELRGKLNALELDPNIRYHIGTGQSSDSLMWGNHKETLKHLLDFARAHPNVALEFKTKSENISYLKEVDIPSNVICTWSLNPQTIIDNEEHLTASLEKRLNAARAMADKGVLVGFHFHPMIYFKGWQEEYGALFEELQKRFSPDEVALVSLGTLTFIKPVLKRLRARDFKTKILQIPLTDAAGKQSYPFEIKKELFSFAYQSLKEWHHKVFFYMCMEDIALWEEVFGYEYADNDALEKAMLDSYFEKIQKKG